VVGSGSQDWQIRRIANANIEFLGVLPPHEVAKTVAGARASVYAGREDFGIALVEAQAAGTPVIAFQDGGADEIVRGLSDPSPTGVLFAEQTVDAIVSAIEVFETNENQISAEQCRANSLRFSADRFHKQFKSFVEQQWELFQHSH